MWNPNRPYSLGRAVGQRGRGSRRRDEAARGGQGSALEGQCSRCCSHTGEFAAHSAEWHKQVWVIETNKAPAAPYHHRGLELGCS